MSETLVTIGLWVLGSLLLAAVITIVWFLAVEVKEQNRQFNDKKSKSWDNDYFENRWFESK